MVCPSRWKVLFLFLFVCTYLDENVPRGRAVAGYLDWLSVRSINRPVAIAGACRVYAGREAKVRSERVDLVERETAKVTTACCGGGGSRSFSAPVASKLL